MKTVTDKCASCGACIKRCPKNAIFFKKKGIQTIAVIDEKKCINCGKCFRLCPRNSEKEMNKVEIKVARINNVENIKKSTSGGIFGELARHILKEKGIVYGVVFSEDKKKVFHTRCDSRDKLNAILKSKYVRSDLKNTFEEAEQDLIEGKTVLYSGTPCQIAGFKKYLQKEYDNLYTVDIVCHGTPSPEVWERYANYLEQTEKSKITSVDFRYLEQKNPSKNFKVTYANGKITKESLYDTSYGRAFLVGLINGSCCGDCKFNNFHNASDLTLGDAWGYKNELYPNKNSIILINNKKGQKIYETILNNLIEFDDFNFKEMLASCYPIIHSTLDHDNAGKIDLKAKNIDKELWHWLDEKNGLKKDRKGVGILNFHYENYNYGANLVAYSLSKAIEKIGYNPYVINFDPFDDPDTITRYQTLAMYKFRKKYLNMTPRFRNKDDLKVLNDYLDMYVVGSDQVWRKAITQKNIYTYFLDFAENKNKISYAASFGKDIFEGNEIDKVHCARLLSSFYNISVRELDGLRILKENFNTTGKITIDPTLLLTKEDYDEIIEEEYKEKVDVGVYFVMDYENKILQDKNLKRLFPKQNIVNLKGEFVNTPYGKTFVYNSMSKWLDGFRKAKYIVTDSYHGLIFSMIYGKKVICIGKNSASLSRFKTLIENVSESIENVMYGSLSEVKSKNKGLNFAEIEKNLKSLRKKSYKYLEENLGTKKIKKEDDFYKNMDEIVMKYNEMEQKLQEVTDEVNKMRYSRSWRITKPVRYLKRVVKRNHE